MQVPKCPEPSPVSSSSLGSETISEVLSGGWSGGVYIRLLLQGRSQTTCVCAAPAVALAAKSERLEDASCHRVLDPLPTGVFQWNPRPQGKRHCRRPQRWVDSPRRRRYVRGFLSQSAGPALNLSGEAPQQTRRPRIALACRPPGNGLAEPRLTCPMPGCPPGDRAYH